MKKVLSALIVAVMLIGMLPAIAIPALAEETSGTTGDCTWTLDGTELTISGNGAMGDYSDWHNEVPWGTSITKVIIEEGVTHIGAYAFYECSDLVSVSIPASVTSIGTEVFWRMPTEMGWISSLESVYITDLAKWCEINFSDSSSNPLRLANKLYLNGELITNVVIPEGVTTIPTYAFSCKNITSITIPDSVTSIEDYAFSRCSGLTSITIGDGVTSIGDYAFNDCTGLTSIEIPDSVTTIGDRAFYGCTKLKKVYISDLVAWCNINFSICFDDWISDYYWDSNPLYYADELYLKDTLITDLVIPDSVTDIKTASFSGFSGLTSVEIPGSVTSIGDGAFWRCSALTSITIPDSVASIGDYAFKNCTGLTLVTIPNSVTYIGDYAFSGCTGLISIGISDSVTAIGRRAFEYCSNLTSITIPDSVTSIGNYAFDGCTNLKEVELLAAVSSIYGLFDRSYNIVRIYLPAELRMVYSNSFDSSSLRRVFFGGTQEQYESMIIQQGNDELIDAKWSYNETGLPEHSYTNVCDKDCNECGMTREVDDHSYDDACDVDCNNCGAPRSVSHQYANATCTTPKTCNICRATSGSALGHNYSAATCTAPKTCTVCGATDGSKLDHSYSNACDTSCNVCGATRTITHSYGEYVYNNDATSQTDGTKTRTCSVCQTTETITAAGTKLQNPFKDVKLDQYYAEPVLWAVGKNITNGTSAGTFSPSNNCTRGQIVTFLWRAAGSPEPKSTANPFADVSADKYYYKAVLWAVENGITTGTSANTFSPDAGCTRGQVVTFLHRAKSKPAASGSNAFADVKAGAYYYDAVLWAVENGITNGMGDGTFAPNKTCTRGQIVTFLYRAYK